MNVDDRRDFEKALALGSGNKDIDFYLGEAFLSEGFKQRSIDHFDRYLEGNPENAPAYCYKGLASLFLRGTNFTVLASFEESLPAFTKALELKPDFLDAYVLRGYAFYHLQNFSAAIEDFRKAVALAPNIPYTHFMLANAYLRQGDQRLACEYFEKTEQLGKDVRRRFKKKACR